MRWIELFADLEAQFDDAERARRAAEVEERTRAEVGRLQLVDRLRTAVGAQLRIDSAHGNSRKGPEAAAVSGRLDQVGSDWVLIVDDYGCEVLVALSAVAGVRGLTRLSAPPGSPGAVESRLGMRSVLRAIARDRSPVRVQAINSATIEGTIDRVGGDFIELAMHPMGEFRRLGEVREFVVVAIDKVATVGRLI